MICTKTIYICLNFSLAMFHFTEHFVKKSIQNGFALLFISAVLMYLSSDEFVHYVYIPAFLIAGGCWIYFGFKFKKLLDSVDEPTNHEFETTKVRIFKLVDSLLSATLILSMILSMGFPTGNAIYFLLSVISVLFIIRIYQIVIISNYLKQEVRN